jgi:hypothetical protein
MKRKAVIALSILIVATVLFWTAGKVYAALAKTSTVDTVDAWQSVTGGTMAVGTAKSVSDSYSTLLYVELAPIEAVASDGAEITVQVSYTSAEWVNLVTVKGTAETVATTKLWNAATDANTVLDLDDGSTGDFDVIARKWFIKDGTIGNSESVRTVSISLNQDNTTADAVTITQHLLRSHANDTDVYDRVDEWVIQIPQAAAYVRVLCNNVDADCDVAFTSRVSKVTGL